MDLIDRFIDSFLSNQDNLSFFLRNVFDSKLYLKDTLFKCIKHDDDMDYFT